MEEYTITVQSCHNGFLVKAGCLTLVFESGESLIQEFTRWAKDPKGTRREYIDRYFQEAPPVNQVNQVLGPALKGRGSF